VNAGLRYDLQFLETVATDTNNLSPRIGVAWLPLPARRTIVRGGAGLLYDRVPLRPVANALLSAGNTTDLSRLQQNSVSLSPAQSGAPVFPDILPAPVPSVTPLNLTTMDARMRNASSRQVSVEVEHQVGTHATAAAGYEYLRGADLIVQVNQNVPSCVAVGSNNGCRPIADYANNNQYSPRGQSTYHGWHLSLVERPAGWGSVRLSYTYARSMNNVGEAFFSAPIDPFDLSKDWGRSDNDRHHRLVTSGALAVRRFQLSGMIQYYSPLPLNVTSGVTTIQGTTGRPLVNGAFIARNAETGNDFFSVNARVSRDFRVTGRIGIELLAEAFNLTNRRNVLARNGSFGAGAYPGNPSPSFRQITAVGDPRALQLGVRVEFR
jgi:hypothetical protein